MRSKLTFTDPEGGEWELEPTVNRSWSFCSMDYDGPPDSRHGDASSVEEAIHSVLVMVWDNLEPDYLPDWDCPHCGKIHKEGCF